MTLVEDILVPAGRAAVTTLAFVLRALVISLAYAHQQFPQATTIAFVLVGTYLAYRFIKRVIRMWINFLISTIKTALTLMVIGVIFAIYLRGFHRFFTRDIYFIGDMFKSAAEEKFDYQKTGYKYASKAFGWGDYDFFRRGAEVLFGTDDVTVDQLNDIKMEAEEFLAENVDGVKNFLKSNGIEFDVNANNVHNFLNNLHF